MSFHASHCRPSILALAIATCYPMLGHAQSVDGNTFAGLGSAITYPRNLVISADGSVVAGIYDTFSAFRWTEAGGMADLGYSQAIVISADGSVIAGFDYTVHAFRWTEAGGMADLGTLGGTYSYANALSADGNVVVGDSYITGDASSHAFRWTQAGGMTDLGTLGGTDSYALALSADGNVVVGSSYTAGNAQYHAFRWTQAGGMADLGTLGGTRSEAYALSADGSVVVGNSHTAGNARFQSFRWTEASGMQSIDDWLSSAGVAVASGWLVADGGEVAMSADGNTLTGVGTNPDGNRELWIARVSAAGSGAVTLSGLQDSLGSTAAGGSQAIASNAMLLNGAHSRPLDRRVDAGQNTFWLAGDWGTDNHGARQGNLGLAELGLGRNFGPFQANISFGQTWSKQDLLHRGQAKVEGNYLLAEAIVPVAGAFSATLGAYRHWGDTVLRRGYLNAGNTDTSTGRPDADTWGLRARIDWEQALQVATIAVSPYVDLTYSEAKLAAYTETGGGFPTRFDSRREKATELRLGSNAKTALTHGLNLFATLEAAHRFERTGARTSGNVIGLFAFDLPGIKNKQDWLRAGVGIEGTLASGKAAVSVNITTQGEVPNAWLAASWQMAF